MTASIELSVAKEASTMTLSILRRSARGDHSARHHKNGLATV